LLNCNICSCPVKKGSFFCVYQAKSNIFPQMFSKTAEIKGETAKFAYKNTGISLAGNA